MKQPEVGRAATGRLGALSPGLGAVATTMIAGVFLARKGPGSPTGRVRRLRPGTNAMYPSIKDLPIVCQLNLPQRALRLYRAAFNRAWLRSGSDAKSRYLVAQNRAWTAVRKHFARDPLGRWTPR